MRTLLFMSLLAGCTTYPTLEEACADSLPGGEVITADIDADVALYMNCHRRQARMPHARVSTSLQPAVESHAAYLTANAPRLNLIFQEPGKEPFTGRTPRARAEAEGFTPTQGTQLMELILTEHGESANVYVGRDLFDIWFAYPVFRQAFLQNPMLNFGVASGDYISEVPDDQGLEDLPVHFTWWNINYQVPVTAYAQPPITVPSNGALDVPARYVHVVDDDILEIGKTYGYPITFTVGVGESGLQIQTAALIGPSGPVSILTLVDGISYNNLRNTAMIVPLDPLTVGAQYTATARISTQEGERTAKTTFSIGSRTIPDFGITDTQARQARFEPLRLELAPATIVGRGPLQAH